MTKYVKPIPANYETDWQDYVPVAGDCFDWLDHETRMRVLEAIDLNDQDDVLEFAQALERPIRYRRRATIAAIQGASLMHRRKVRYGLQEKEKETLNG